MILQPITFLDDADSNRNTESKQKGPFTKLKVYKKVRVFPQGGEESTNTPAWPMPQIVVHEDESFLDAADRAIVGNISFAPGLGNIMFQYAALFSIAKRYDAKLLISAKTTLRRAYQVEANYVTPELTNKLVGMWNRTVLTHCCAYYPLVEHMNITRNTFFAYFQSFRYFHPQYEHEIRQQFTFLPDVQSRASITFKKAVDWLDEHEGGACSEQMVYIGVHVRRGIDMTWNLRNVEHGHTAATARYYKSAMDFYRDKFTPNCTRFIVISDNQDWCKSTFEGDPSVYLVESGSREVDMAVLTTRTQHTIMSQGTFSWWIAYLTGGQVVYYKGWPRPGSTMDKMTNKTDYFLPAWVPM